MMICITAIFIMMKASVIAVKETHHFIQTDHRGRVVSMDINYDTDKHTMLAVIGDVSKYKEGRHTVNLHDYSTGYGVLKDIQRKVCFTGRSPISRAMPEKYRVGKSNEVHDHFLEIKPLRLTSEEVGNIAGPVIAAFCNDYATYFVKATPLDEHKRSTVYVLSTLPGKPEGTYGLPFVSPSVSPSVSHIYGILR